MNNSFSLIEQFSENCIAHPNDTAIIDVRTDTSMTYHELDVASGRVYRYLTEHGIGREDVVMILLPRSAKPFAVIVGVWKAGAAYILLETNHPAEKREFIKRDANCKLVVDENVYDEMMQRDVLQGYKTADPHDLSYIVYTSGTTGNPKGVLHEYGTQYLSVKRLLEKNTKQLYGDRAYGDRALLATPLSFTATIMAFQQTIAVFSTMVVLPLSDVKNTEKTLSVIEKYDINVAAFVPSLLRLLPGMPECVEKIATGGEPVNGIYYEGVDIFCRYGQSESGFDVLMFRLDKKYDKAPAGKPTLPEADVCLLDEDGNPVASGEIGEVCYKNPYFRGYLGLPDKNAAVFRNGYIRSGDLAKILPDGNYQVLGRTDDMVKINGNRVEPAEIESVVKSVLQTEWVGARAFVEEGMSFVCAYYIGEPKIEIDEAKKIIQSKLVPYMVPAFYIKLDQIPLNANGKFSRSSLPKPDFSDYRKEYIEPSNELEKKLCSAFEEILGIESVGAEDDFYAIGGDSLTAIRLVALLDMEALDTGMIFDGRTPKEIAKLYENAITGEIESIAAKNEKALKIDHPLSDEQLYMFDYQCQYPKSTVWNIPVLLKFGCDTDMERLKEAVDSTLKAHTVFSIVYVYDESTQLVQRYDPEKVFDTPIELISEADFVDESENLVQPFDLLKKPMYRVRIFKTERGGYLFFDLHHSIADGGSIRILVRDICLAYSGKTLGPDYYLLSCEEREEKKKSPLFEEAKDYYEELLGRYDWDTRLKADVETYKNTYGNMSAMIPVDEPSYKKLEDMYNVGKNAFYIAVAALSMAAYNGSDNVRVSWVYNGRHAASEKNVVGALLRDLYVWIRLDDKKMLKDLFNDVKTQVDKNIYYSFYPYPGPVDFSVIYQANLRSVAAIGMLEFTVAEIPNKNDCADNLLDIEIHETDEGCRLYMDYNASVYKEESIYRFKKMFLKTACLLMENLDKPEMKAADIIKRIG